MRNKLVSKKFITSFICNAFFITLIAANPLDNERELQDLGDTLKAAVMSGAMNENDARKAYLIIAERLGTRKSNANLDKKNDSKDDKKETTKQNNLRLNTPSPLNIEALFYPEFLNRDLLPLSEDLNLDETQTLILRAILENYTDAFNIAILPLDQALKNYERALTDRWLTAVLGDIAIPNAQEAETSIREQINNWRTSKNIEEESEQSSKINDFEEHLVALTRDMDARLKSLQQRVMTDINKIENIDITASDLLIIAQKLKNEREQLRLDLIESVKVILLDKQRGTNDSAIYTAINSQLIRHLLPRGHLSGDAMNLWSAISKIDLPDNMDSGGFKHANTTLKNRVNDSAEALYKRLNATVEREIAGLEFQVAIDNEHSPLPIQGNQLTSTKFERSIETEIASSIEVRNQLLGLLEESMAGCTTTYDQALLSHYRTAALRQGFPQEMRKRWCETAINLALNIEGIEATTLKMLNLINEEMNLELIQLQKEAIANRIEHENNLAESNFENNNDKSEYPLELWFGMKYQEFDELNIYIENQLKYLLTDEQFANLPKLNNRLERSKNNKKTSGKKNTNNKKGQK